MRTKSKLEHICSLGPWPNGVNERVSDFDVAKGELKQSINFNILNSGRLEKRDGYAKLLTLTNAHSLKHFNNSFVFVDDGILYEGLAKNSLVKLDYPLRKICYVELNNELWFSNGYEGGVVDDQWHFYDWYIPIPNKPKALLAAGDLNICVLLTYVNEKGTEGGASDIALYKIAEATPNIQIAIDIVPQGFTANVYSTSINSDVYYFNGSAPEGASSYDLYVDKADNALLDTRYSTSLPYGDLMSEAFGRLWASKNNVLYFSDALVYGIMSQQDNYFMFPSNINMLIPVSSGIYIGSDKTYFLSGTNPTEMSIMLIHEHPVVDGSGISVPGIMLDKVDSSIVAYWFSNILGPCIGQDAGKVQAVCHDKLKKHFYKSGTSFYRDTNNIQLLGTNFRG